jgi:hypothetical protein
MTTQGTAGRRCHQAFHDVGVRLHVLDPVQVHVLSDDDDDALTTGSRQSAGDGRQRWTAALLMPLR